MFTLYYGKIILKDRDVTRLTPAERAIGYVPQDLVLFKTMTVEDVTFEDLETGTKLKVNAIEAKKQYLKSLNDMILKTKDLLLANDISYHLFRLDDHMGEALQLFLKKRSNLL